MNTLSEVNQEAQPQEEGEVTQSEAPLASNEKEPEDKTVIIEVANPNDEEMGELLKNIQIGYDAEVDVKKVIFNFKKTKDKDTGIETLRRPVELAIPYPSMEGLVTILQKGGKGLELLTEAIEGVITSAAREILSEGLALTAATFPVEKLSWEFIANLPKSQRRGGGIPKETWEAFAVDYISVMPAATDKNVEQVTRAAKILVGRLAAVKTNEPVLNLLVQMLAIYLENSKNAAEFMEVVEFLLDKADTYLNVTDEDLLANL